MNRMPEPRIVREEIILLVTIPAGEDNFALARNLGVTLRIDLLQQATQNLMTTAQTTETTDNATYRMSINTFDVGFNTVWALTSSLSAAQTAAGNITQLEVYNNNCLNAAQYSSGTCNHDEDTDFENAMNQVNSTMPNPGQGTAAQGDTPQEVLFIVTDGVDDKYISSDPGLASSLGNYYSSQNREQSVMNAVGGTNWCTTVKNRGIRIAVLYTEWVCPCRQIPGTSIFKVPEQVSRRSRRSIGAQLQSCASPSLYFKVQTGGDISGAMSALFQAAVTTAYLSK